MMSIERRLPFGHRARQGGTRDWFVGQQVARLDETTAAHQKEAGWAPLLFSIWSRLAENDGAVVQKAQPSGALQKLVGVGDGALEVTHHARGVPSPLGALFGRRFVGFFRGDEEVFRGRDERRLEALLRAGRRGDSQPVAIGEHGEAAREHWLVRCPSLGGFYGAGAKDTGGG